MTDERDDARNPMKVLPAELEPPADLESRVLRALAARHLVHPDAGARSTPAMRRLATAAVVILGSALAFWLGRASVSDRPTVSTADPDRTRYALLLYETASYDRAEGAEEGERYDEYSRWVAEARRRGQFVTGEDLSVEEGFTMDPSQPESELVLDRVVSAPGAGAVLSGLFLVTASDLEDARSLAASLPHLRHGGHVVVQRVLRTDVPPPAEAEP